jgi:hypothetical protein
LFNAKTEYFQFEAGPTFKEQIVNSLKEQNLADEEFIGIALPFNSSGGHIVVSQSAKEVGKFQVTVIGADNQPVSDFGQQTKEEALETFLIMSILQRHTTVSMRSLKRCTWMFLITKKSKLRKLALNGIRKKNPGT